MQGESKISESSHFTRCSLYQNEFSRPRLVSMFSVTDTSFLASQVSQDVISNTKLTTRSHNVLCLIRNSNPFPWQVNYPVCSSVPADYLTLPNFVYRIIRTSYNLKFQSELGLLASCKGMDIIDFFQDLRLRRNFIVTESCSPKFFFYVITFYSGSGLCK